MLNYGCRILINLLCTCEELTTVTQFINTSKNAHPLFIDKADIPGSYVVQIFFNDTDLYIDFMNNFNLLKG